MAEPMSDEELYQLTGSWEAAAALRDEQARGANTAQAPVVETAKPATLSATPTLAELKAMYNQLGASEERHTGGESGDTIDTIPIQYGQGWTAWDKAPAIVGYREGSGGGEGGDQPVPIYDDKKQLGGFAKQEGDYITSYDLDGNVVKREKMDHDNFLKTMIKDLGPLAMAAMTMGGGAGLLGNSLFGLTGAGASAAGGALAGSLNAYGNDNNIFKGALTGALSGAGSAKLGDILGSDVLGETFKDAKVGDVTKAINFAKNPTLEGAANIASPYMPNVSLGDGAVSLNDVLKGVSTAQALGSGDYGRIFNAITGVAKGGNTMGLSSDEQDQITQNRETKRLNRIEDAVLNQPASDDGTTQGILDLINEMYPAAEVKGMSQADLAKFLEANMGEIQGSADLETLLKGEGKKTADEGTVNITGNKEVGTDLSLPTTKTKSIGDQGTIVVTGDRPKNLGETVITGDRPKGDVTLPDNLEEMDITDKKDEPYVPSLRTKEIKSDIPDEITPADITKLFPDLKIDDILQLLTTTTPATKVTPTKVTTPTTTKKSDPLLSVLGLDQGQAPPSQDPYAHIKSMEDLFGGDIAYKLRALGVPASLASSDIDALTRLLRNKNV